MCYNEKECFKRCFIGTILDIYIHDEKNADEFNLNK